MAYSTVNMLLESQKFDSLETFLRARDSKEAIANFIIDEGNRATFFQNIPGLVSQEYQLDKAV